MAVRRMFAISVVCSDAFMSLPAGAKTLYIYLNLQADDDGLVDNPMVVMRLTRTTKSDLSRLIETGFVLSLGQGVVAIKHWQIHNKVRKDRYVPTKYQKELSTLDITPDGRYVRRTIPAAGGSN